MPSNTEEKVVLGMERQEGSFEVNILSGPQFYQLYKGQQTFWKVSESELFRLSHCHVKASIENIWMNKLENDHISIKFYFIKQVQVAWIC